MKDPNITPKLEEIADLMAREYGTEAQNSGAKRTSMFSQPIGQPTNTVPQQSERDTTDSSPPPVQFRPTPRIQLVPEQEARPTATEPQGHAVVAALRKRRLPVAVGAALIAATGLFVAYGPLDTAASALATAKANLEPTDAQTYYDIQKPACAVEEAFVADVRATATLLPKITLIDTRDPKLVQKVPAARAKAFADKTYKPPKELTDTRIFDKGAYAMYLPEIPPYSTELTSPTAAPAKDDKDIKYTRRLRQAGYIAPKLPLGICLTGDKRTMADKTVVEQRSPKHLVVHMDNFSVVANNEADDAINDYETDPPQMPIFAPSIPAADRQSLLTQTEIDRVYKVLAPAGKYNAKISKFESGVERNPKIKNGMKLLVLSALSKGENRAALQADAERALAEGIRSDIETQLDEVNKKNGTNLRPEDIVIKFEGAVTGPAEAFAKAVKIPVGEFALVDETVVYRSIEQEKKVQP